MKAAQSNPIESRLNPFDLMIIFILTIFTVRIPPDLRYLSYRFGSEINMSNNIFSNEITALSTLLILVYFMLMTNTRHRWSLRGKLLIICFFITGYVILPTISDMTARHELGLRHKGNFVSIAHDGGVLQTEEAIKFFLKGESPYSADYHGTEMEEGVDSNPELWKSMGYEENPSFNYYSYPPLAFLVSMPLYLLFHSMTGWYDQRILYLILLVILICIAYRMPKQNDWRLPLLVVAALNPISAFYFIRGTNDIMCLTFILATLMALDRSRYRSASLLLGLACMVKQFAWLLVPLFLMYIYAQSEDRKITAKLRQLIKLSWPLFGVWTGVLLPFLIWDPEGVFRSLIQANATIYPFRAGSLGVTNFLIAFHLVESPQSYFPNYIFYFCIVLPLYFLSFKKILTEKTIASMTIGFTILLCLFLYFSKHFAQNYFGLVFAMMTVSIMWHRGEKSVIDPHSRTDHLS